MSVPERKSWHKNFKVTSDGMLRLYQSYFADEQLRFVSRLAKPYHVGSNTGPASREYELFKSIQSEMDHDEPWGLLSWKFNGKSPISLDEFHEFAGIQFENGADCVFINPMIGNEAVFINVWEQGILSHPGMEKIASFLLPTLGQSVTGASGKYQFSFCNYFVGTEKFWKAYFSFIDSKVDLLDREAKSDTEVGRAWTNSAGYQRDLSLTMRPFIIERLFTSMVAAREGLKFAPFVCNKKHYVLKFGMRLGSVLHRLSEMKNKAIMDQDRAAFIEWMDVRKQYLNNLTAGMIFNLDDPPSVLYQ